MANEETADYGPLQKLFVTWIGIRDWTSPLKFNDSKRTHITKQLFLKKQGMLIMIALKP